MSISWDDHKELAIVKDSLSPRYELLAYLGGGAFGKVFKLKDKSLERDCALKVLNIDKLNESSNEECKNKKDRFIKEAKGYAKCHHSNIVKIFDIGGEDTFPYFIMEYINGESLKSVIAEKGKLNLKDVFKISNEVLSALQCIHQNGLVHRDITPANIMIEEKNGRSIIIDFGIAKDLRSNSTIKSDIAFGTLGYMAPEQFNDFSKVTRKADIYSFGVVVYEMLTGEVPFNFNAPVPNIREKNPDLPVGIEEIISKAMNKTPDERFKSAEDFWIELSKVGETKKLKSWKDKKKIKEKLREYISVIVTSIGIVVTLIAIFNPFKSTDPIIRPGNVSVTVQSENMNRDFDDLKVFLKGKSSNKDKLQKCREFLGKHQNTPGNKDTLAQAILDEANRFISQLNTGIQDDEQHQRYIDAVNNLIKSGDYEGAKRELAKARKINDTDEVKRLSTTIVEKLEKERYNGEKEYKAIKDKMNLSQYQVFHKNYLNSVHLPELRDRLKTADKNLPPEKYWDKPIRKNGKGYYEITFGSELNGHQMIYIPEKKTWIDKYEVSWAQFNKFVNEANIQFQPIQGSKYINNGNEYPAIVTYENAQNYCQKYGLKLPSADEWEYAAGKGTSIYPWGNESPDENGIYRANYDSLLGTDEKDGFVGTAPVNCFEKFSSPFGVVNMAGNVWEWVQGNILKGGGFLSSKENLKIQNSKTGNDDKEGFRCIKLEK